MTVDGDSVNVKEYKSEVAALGCLFTGKPAELHHPRFCIGMGQRASDWLVIPLAPELHRNGNYGECIHNGQTAFEKNMGMTEQEMVAETIKRMMNR
jgi:hypothetical protein